MEPLAMLAALSSPMGTELAWSALPDAPAVPEGSRTPRAARSRLVVASGLHRLADAVTPPAACQSA
jgi:hypothetical protein